MRVRTFFTRGAKPGLVIAAVLAMTAALLVGSVAWADDEDPGVVPVDEKAWGTTYEELAIEWWTWAWGAPAGQCPIDDPDGRLGHVGQKGKIWFLAGNRGGQTTRYLIVPNNRALFFPIVNIAWIPYASDPPPGDPGYMDEAAARDLINWLMDLAYNWPMSCTIDGVEVQDVAGYRAESPTIAFPIKEGSCGEQESGWTGLHWPSMADGYWLLLDPLPEGEHVIEFSGGFGPPDQLWFSLHVTYYLMVVDDDDDDHDGDDDD